MDFEGGVCTFESWLCSRGLSLLFSDFYFVALFLFHNLVLVLFSTWFLVSSEPLGSVSPEHELLPVSHRSREEGSPSCMVSLGRPSTLYTNFCLAFLFVALQLTPNSGGQGGHPGVLWRQIRLDGVGVSLCRHFFILLLMNSPSAYHPFKIYSLFFVDPDPVLFVY